tara:strand:+ start:662 stop:889 length:228 start_codon:yes stop_codon:yes gene_type:complete
MMFKAVIFLFIYTGEVGIPTIINDPLPPTKTFSECLLRGANIIKVIYQGKHVIVEARAGCVKVKKENNDKVEKDV